MGHKEDLSVIIFRIIKGKRRANNTIQDGAISFDTSYMPSKSLKHI